MIIHQGNLTINYQISLSVLTFFLILSSTGCILLTNCSDQSVIHYSHVYKRKQLKCLKGNNSFDMKGSINFLLLLKYMYNSVMPYCLYFISNRIRNLITFARHVYVSFSVDTADRELKGLPHAK